MEKRAMCFVCRLSFNTAKPNGVFFGNDISRMRKQECAETISNLLLGSCTHPLNIYFQSAAYCIRCTKILLDVNFSWKQLTALENRINHNLKVLRILFKKNFEGILNKVEMDIPEVDPENLQEWESFTYDEVIQICMKVMHVEDAESIFHPDQLHTVDPNDFLKTYFDAVNDEEDYIYQNSLEGKVQVKESDLLGNLVGSSDRIQIYAKDDDSDSSFEVSSDDSDSSSYCSSDSGGKRRRKIRKKTTVQNQNNPNAPPGSAGAGVVPNVQGATPNGLPPTSVPGGIPNSEQPGSTPQIQKPIGGLPIQIASINQFVSSEFLKKFPIPVDKNKIVETKPVAVPCTVEKPVPPLISMVKTEADNNETKSLPPPPTISEDQQPKSPTISSISAGIAPKILPLPTDAAGNSPKPPETNVPQISVKSVLNSTMIPVINFKPKPAPVVTNTASEAVKPPTEMVKPPSELNIPTVGNSSLKNVTTNANAQVVSVNSRKPGPASMTKNYPPNSSHFSTVNNRPGPSSLTKPAAVRHVATRGNYKPAQRSRLAPPTPTTNYKSSQRSRSPSNYKPGRPRSRLPPTSNYRSSSQRSRSPPNYKPGPRSRLPPTSNYRSSSQRSRSTANNLQTGPRSRLPPTKNNVKKKRSKGGHDSDIQSCSSFSSDESMSSDLDSSSDDTNTIYHRTPLAKMQTHKKKSGNCSSGSSIVVLSD